MWSSVLPRTCPPPSSPGLSHSHTSKTKLSNVCVQDPREGRERGEKARGEKRRAWADVYFYLLLSLEQKDNAGSSSASSSFPTPSFPAPPPYPQPPVLSVKGDLKARSGGCGWFGEREDKKPTAQIGDPRLAEACQRAAFPFFAALRLQ